MPSSSNPLNLVSAGLLALMGVPCTFLGLVGVLAESGSMRLVWGMLALGGLGMTWGAVQAVLAWRRAEVRERGHEAALYQAVRQVAPVAEPRQALQERSRPIRPAEPAVADGPAAAPAPVEAPVQAPAASAGREAEAEVLAHWTYAPDEWSAYTRGELRFRSGEARWLGLGVALLGILILAFREDTDSRIAAAVSIVIGSVIYLGKMLQARSAHAANTATRGGEVVISPNAVLLNGRYHVLQDDRFHFAGVRLLDEDDPPVLEFTVAWRTRSGRADEQVYVPVPRGREEEARALAASFPGKAGDRG